jgi:hypothetical protein
MGDDIPIKARLYQATDTLGQELLFIKSSLASYCVIGLNASKLESGKLIFGHLQRLCLLNVALGLAKVFEKEKEGGYELCSVSGVLRLAKGTPIEEITALHTFATKYGVKPQDSWSGEIDEVFAKQRSTIARHMRLVTKARDTRIAHLQQAAPLDDLPSIWAFEQLLNFAVGFHAFVNRGFLQTNAHPILTDVRVADSLCAVLKLAGVDDVVTDFPDLAASTGGPGRAGDRRTPRR